MTGYDSEAHDHKPTRPRGSRSIRLLSVFLIAAAAALPALLITSLIVQREQSAGDASRPSIAVPEDAGIVVPPFEFTDMNGSTITEDYLDGRYTVMDFFFTHCPFACPGMAAQMKRVQAETRGTGVQMLSISVDGERDTPDRIRRYAEGLGADPARWRFATGNPRRVAEFCRDGLKFAISVDKSTLIPLPEGDSMANIQHPTRLILIGPDRRMLATASYTIDEEVDQLIEFASRLASRSDIGG